MAPSNKKKEEATTGGKEKEDLKSFIATTVKETMSALSQPDSPQKETKFESIDVAYDMSSEASFMVVPTECVSFETSEAIRKIKASACKPGNLSMLVDGAATVAIVEDEHVLCEVRNEDVHVQVGGGVIM